jgi:hypothetical protein
MDPDSQLTTTTPPPALRQTTEFRAHVERMMRPVLHGCGVVKGVEFMEEVFFDTVDLSEFPLHLIDLAREKALGAFATYEALLLDTVEKCVLNYMENPDVYGVGTIISWNAPDADALDTNLQDWMVRNFNIWLNDEFKVFCTEVDLDTNLLEGDKVELIWYVEEFVGTAMASISHYAVEAEDVEYDSADTEPGGDL